MKKGKKGRMEGVEERWKDGKGGGKMEGWKGWRKDGRMEGVEERWKDGKGGGRIEGIGKSGEKVEGIEEGWRGWSR